MSRTTVDPPGVVPVLSAQDPVLLVGAGPVVPEDLKAARGFCQRIVAADGGAVALHAAAIRPDAVIGDMDSLPRAVQAQLDHRTLHPVAEQDSTDFEKCLTRIDAPLVLAVGFSAGRMDHLLSVINAMVRHPKRRCILVGSADVGLQLPPSLHVPLDPGTTVSLFPLAEMTVTSRGLHWPTAKVQFRPDGQVGTSNRATGPVELATPAPGMLLFVPRNNLGLMVLALKAAPGW